MTGPFDGSAGGAVGFGAAAVLVWSSGFSLIFANGFAEPCDGASILAIGRLILAADGFATGTGLGSLTG